MGIWESISEGIAEFAPTIAKTILPGPIGGIASIGIKALTDSLGLTSEEAKSPKTIKKAVQSMTPELALKLRQENNSFLTKMKELGVEEHKLFNADRSSARERDIKTGDNSTKKIAWVFIIGFFVTIVFLLLLLGFSKKLGIETEVFTTIAALAGSIIGTLGTKVDQILSYFYGDSENGNTMGKELTKTLNENINR